MFFRKNRDKVTPRFIKKLVSSMIILFILGIVGVSFITHTLVRDIIYDHLIAIAQQKQAQYAYEIDQWFMLARQRVNDLPITLKTAENRQQIENIAVAFTSMCPTIDNTFIGFSDGSVINGIGWVPPEGWTSVERPWYIAARQAGEGNIGFTEPYLSHSTGNMAMALSTYVPNLMGTGAAVGYTITIDTILARAFEQPVMGGGYLLLVDNITADSKIMVHPNIEFNPGPGRFTSLIDIPNGDFFKKHIQERVSVRFEDFRLGSAYLISTPLTALDWTVFHIIPTAETDVIVARYMFGIIGILTGFVLVLFSIALATILRISRGLGDLRESESRLRLILEHVHVATNFRDRDLNLADCNNAAPKLFDLRSKEEYYEKFNELSPEFQPDGQKSTEKAAAYVAEAFEKGEARFEWIHQKLNGEPVPCDIKLARVPWKNKEHLLASIYDLRYFYKYQEAERLAKERLQVMLDSSPLACLLFDENLNVIDANKEILTLVEAPDKSYFIENFSSFMPEYQPDKSLSASKVNEMRNIVFSEGSATFEWVGLSYTGREIPFEIHAVHTTLEGNKIILAYLRDLRDIKTAVAMAEKLELLAYRDTLTGLSNRRHFEKLGWQTLQDCAAQNKDFSLMIFDIDHFKLINDKYGHAAGDEVLQIIASRTKSVIKEDTPFARIGGEEFVIILAADCKSAEVVAARIKEHISASPFSIKGHDINVTASFGVASKSHETELLPDILNNADHALYQAKNSGRNAVVCFCNSQKNKN